MIKVYPFIWLIIQMAKQTSNLKIKTDWCNHKQVLKLQFIKKKKKSCSNPKHIRSYLFLIRAFISPHYDLTSTLKSY